MTDLIFATKNAGKMREIREIMKDTNFNVLSMDEIGIDIDVEENGTTFEENATIKAVAIMKECGKIVLSDDSGLEIDYLDKAPGVYSARYMGEKTPYIEKNTKILEMLEGVPEEKRTARFVSAISAAIPKGDSYEVITTLATIEGIIGYEIKGDNGFGYDPIFYVPEYKLTTAEMSMEQKNQISHRGKALKAMKEKLMEYFK